MRIRSFDAGSMKEAMEALREELGDDAVIISTMRAPGGKGIRVTAAVDDDEEPIQEEDNIATAARDRRSDVMHQLDRVLHYHHLPHHLLEKLMEVARYLDAGDIDTLLAKTLSTCFAFEPVALDDPKRLLLVGEPGAGKTVTSAKLAAQAVMAEQPVHLYTTDSVRAGGIDQLQAFADILDIPLHVIREPSLLRYDLVNAPGEELIVIDSAGINPFDRDDLEMLAELVAGAGVEPVLVITASGDADDMGDICETFARLGCHRVIITKADMTRRLGNMLAAASQSGLALSNLARSGNVANGLERLNGSLLSGIMLELYRRNAGHE